MPSGFFDRLRSSARARDSLLCVGLDPDPERIEGGLAGAVRVCTGVIATTADIACCYKPNAAFWEQYGPEGWEGLAEVRAAIPGDVPVLLDAKRADVAHTMRAYARGIFEAFAMDAVTVHAYHGKDSLQAFTRYADRGVYVVCHTSNPGRVDLQHLPAPSEPLYVRVAQLADAVNVHGNVGVVAAATAPEEAAVLRRAFPAMPFLMPGVGRQGGDVDAAVRAGWNGDEACCLVAVAGGVMYAPDPAAAAVEWRDRIRAAVSACRAGA